MKENLQKILTNLTTNVISITEAETELLNLFKINNLIIDEFSAEVLWDENSEYIGEHIYDLQEVAGQSIMKHKNFMKVMKKFIPN